MTDQQPVGTALVVRYGPKGTQIARVVRIRRGMMLLRRFRKDSGTWTQGLRPYWDYIRVATAEDLIAYGVRGVRGDPARFEVR